MLGPIFPKVETVIVPTYDFWWRRRRTTIVSRAGGAERHLCRVPQSGAQLPLKKQ